VSAGVTIARESVPRDNFGSPEVAIAVIDGPYDAVGLNKILAQPPISLGNRPCKPQAGSACEHGTFVMGLLGARRDAPVPGICPDCKLLHIPLFSDDDANGADVSELASAVELAVAAGARLINLSLAVLGDDRDFHVALGSALDRAYAAGSVIVAAAGNQGRPARGQLVSHPATIPVVAVDARGQVLPSSNLSPEIARRGVAMFGSDVLGYGLGGELTRMSGTSAAAAIATGILVAIFGSRSDATVSDMRAAIARLGPRGGEVPPMLDYAQIIAALDAAKIAQNGMGVQARLSIRGEDYQNFGGNPIMQTSGDVRSANRASSSVAARHPALALAGEAGECSCGAPGGVCTCNENQSTHSGFVYAIGTVEAEYPNVAIEREMQAIAHALGVQTTPDADMPMKQTEDRTWQHAVLSKDRKMTRYLARQLSWRLTIEDSPVFVLNPRCPSDFDELIDCLARPKYPKANPGKGKRAGKGRSTFIDPPFGPPQDLDVVVGVRGSQTPDGIEVLMDQVFTMQPVPGLGEHFVQMADNWGLSDEDRAYNFLVARYELTAQNIAGIHKDYKLTGVPTFSSRLSGSAGRIVRAVFTYSGDNTALEEKYFVRVDVTHEFPFIVTTWHPYLERGEAS